MPRSSCGSCRAPLSDGDHHVICVSCLGEDHAALALAEGGCPHSELMPMVTLRTRLAFFSETAPSPAVLPRRKKRRAQRVPEPPPFRESSPVRPPASPPASPESLTAGQRPLSAAASAIGDYEEAECVEDDSCSLLASGSEDWSSSADLAPSSHRPPGKRASIEAELMRLLEQAVESLGLEWSTPQQPAHNRLDGCFLQRDRASQPSRPAPFLPELHEEVAKSWNAPFSARVRAPVSAAFSVVSPFAPLNPLHRP